MKNLIVLISLMVSGVSYADTKIITCIDTSALRLKVVLEETGDTITDRFTTASNPDGVAGLAQLESAPTLEDRDFVYASKFKPSWTLTIHANKTATLDIYSKTMMNKLGTDTSQHHLKCQYWTY